MNLQNLDKQQNLRRINLLNEYKAYTWKNSKGNLKYIETLNNEIYSSGTSFIVLWENLEYFLSIKEKYSSIGDAKNFVKDTVIQFSKEYHFPLIQLLYKYDEIEKLTKEALKDDETYTAKLTCRYITYSSVYDLLVEIVAKVLTGFTFDVAYFDLTNNKPINCQLDFDVAHSKLSSFYINEYESDYIFFAYKPQSENEYLLKYDISTLSNIVSEITDANIYLYDIITPNRDGVIFNETDEYQNIKANIHEFAVTPFVEIADLKIEVETKHLQNEIVVCVFYLDSIDGKVKTFSTEKEVSIDDVYTKLEDLVRKPIYLLNHEDNTYGTGVIICWIEVL